MTYVTYVYGFPVFKFQLHTLFAGLLFRTLDISAVLVLAGIFRSLGGCGTRARRDRKSTRLNSSHSQISYAVFCLKKKKEIKYTVEINTRQKQRHHHTLHAGHSVEIATDYRVAHHTDLQLQHAQRPHTPSSRALYI